MILLQRSKYKEALIDSLVNKSSPEKHMQKTTNERNRQEKQTRVSDVEDGKLLPFVRHFSCFIIVFFFPPLSMVSCVVHFHRLFISIFSHVCFILIYICIYII